MGYYIFNSPVDGDYLLLEDVAAVLWPDRSHRTVLRWHYSGCVPKVPGVKGTGKRVRLRTIRRCGKRWTTAKWIVNFILEMGGIDPGLIRTREEMEWGNE